MDHPAPKLVHCLKKKSKGLVITAKPDPQKVLEKA